jgi:hypothetical protein
MAASRERAGSVFGIGGGHHPLHHPAGFAQHRLGDEVLSRGEVLVERLAREPGPLGHVGLPRATDAVHGGDLERGVEQPLAGVKHGQTTPQDMTTR